MSKLKMGLLCKGLLGIMIKLIIELIIKDIQLLIFQGG